MQQWATRHHQVVRFLYNRELACFTADIHIRLLRSLQYLHTEIKQASTQYFVQLLLQAVRYNHCMQIAWRQRQSLEFPQSNPKVSLPILWAQAEVLSFIKDALFPNFHKTLQDGVLVIGVQQLENSSAFASKLLRSDVTWWVMGQKKFNGEHYGGEFSTDIVLIYVPVK